MDYFAKKQWIRITVCAVLVGVIVLAMTGVFSGSKELIYDPAATNGDAAASAEATEQGFAGDVTVHVTLDGDKISTLSIDTPNETEGLGKRASDAAFSDQFIGKSGPFIYGEDGIEALSGATVTSNAALKAINRAIGAEAPAEEKPAEEPAAEGQPAETAPAESEAPKTPPAYAGYRVDKKNSFSRITVIAYAKNGMLVSVKILSEGEEGKDLLTDEIKAEWAKAILESQSAAPDAISGATLTYSAASVQEAMAEILEKAAGR